MTDSEKRESSRQFYQKWVGKGKEDEDDRSYWIDILQRILGAEDATDRVEFQKKVIVENLFYCRFLGGCFHDSCHFCTA